MAISPSLAILRGAKALHGADLLARSMVHSVGIGLRIDPDSGRPTEEAGLVVLLSEPQPEDLPSDQVVPSFVPYSDHSRDGEVEVPVFVWVSPLPKISVLPGVGSAALKAHARPAPGGVNIGVDGVYEEGTLGGWVWDAHDKRIVLLSNRHVLHEPCCAETEIVQPSYPRPGSDSLAVRTRMAPGEMDAAIAEPAQVADAEFTVLGLGPAVFEVGEVVLSPDTEVVKTGIRTGVSEGVVTVTELDGELSADVFMILGEGNEGHTWDSSIEAKAFSDKGDSGSLVLAKDLSPGMSWRCVLGLLYSDGDAKIEDQVTHIKVERQISYAFKITRVFEVLKLKPICTGLLTDIVDAIMDGLGGWTIGGAEAIPRMESMHELPPHSFQARDLPPPASEREGAGGHFQGFPRAFEARIRGSHLGESFLARLRERRVEVVRVLMNQDGWRATTTALAPFLAGAVTTDQVLDHRITAQDIEKIRLACRVALRVSPDVDSVVQVVLPLLESAEGKPLGSLIFGEGSEWGGR